MTDWSLYDELLNVQEFTVAVPEVALLATCFHAGFFAWLILQP
jgi:hypothetical protein